jgi:transcriptional regulator with XRE-family HTH domain
MVISASEHAFFVRLGVRIAELRKSQDITQVEMAKTLGVSQQTINSYEVGRRRIPVSALSTLARALGVSLEELLGEESAAAAKKRGPAPKLQQQMERIQHLPRAQQRFVIPDRELAAIYFMFQLSRTEAGAAARTSSTSRSPSPIMGPSRPPMSELTSRRRDGIYVVRAFVKLRDLLSSNRELARRFAQLETRFDKKLTEHDEAIAAILSAIRQLMGKSSTH